MADREVLALNGHDGKDIREIEDAEQAGFAMGDFAAGFGRNDDGPCPRWKPEKAAASRGRVVSLGA